jgi:hypothetical protein
VKWVRKLIAAGHIENLSKAAIRIADEISNHQSDPLLTRLGH